MWMAALMRLPALKVKKREKNMCNLSRKEGSSLFAVLTKRSGRRCQRTFTFTLSGSVFLSGGWRCGLESNRVGLTRSVLMRKKTQPGRWKRPHVTAGGSLGSAGETLGSGLRMSLPHAKLSARRQCSRCLSPGAFSGVPPTGWCLAVLFFHSRSRPILYT